MRARKINPAKVRRLLDYDPVTGTFHWKVANSNRVKVGDVAGHVSASTGYRTIGIDGIDWPAAVLAWVHVKGRFPKKIVDHISRDKSDDSFGNLRLATFSQNCANSSVHRDNGSGLKGVEFHPATGKWRARICVNGKRRSLGLHPSPELAHAAYLSAAKQVFGKFATGGYNRKEK